MGLAGRGAVAIWHDIEPEGREEFYAWHGVEHMPERVAIPGFLRGRRYVASEADLEFFNLYEARDHAVVTGPDYAARLNAPTPWTLKTVKHFRSVARSNLLKCAIHGEDPNWGRVLAAVGVTDAEFEPDRLNVAINGIWVCRGGAAGDDRAKVDLRPRDVTITVDLSAGPCTATIHTTDLTAEYVHENSAYST